MFCHDVLFVFAGAGWGTRLRQAGTLSLPKIIYPLADEKGWTPLEYHLRLLAPPTTIGLIAGYHKAIVADYLSKQNVFGHEAEHLHWIPTLFHPPLVENNAPSAGLPNFPYGAGAWLVFEEELITSFQRQGISIIVQTDGNKVGERSEIVMKMIEQLRASNAEWVVAIYNDMRPDMAAANSNWHKRFDILCDAKGYPKGYAPNEGEIIAGWYALKINSLPRLWNAQIRQALEEKAAQYPQKRQLHWNNEAINLKIVEINLPILLEYFRLETFAASRDRADLGIGLKTASDISKCKDLFARREEEGALRKC